MTGASRDAQSDATAFWHRDRPYMVTFEANWVDPADDEANVAWVREAFAEVESLSVASGRCGNFPGFAEDPTHLLFGENYDRLVEVNTRYDPANLFHRNQNVQPRKPAAAAPTTDRPVERDDDQASSGEAT